MVLLPACPFLTWLQLSDFLLIFYYFERGHKANVGMKIEWTYRKPANRIPGVQLEG